MIALKRESHGTDEGLSPMWQSPLQMPVPNNRLPTTSKQLGYKLDIPAFLFSDLINLLQWITELRNTFTSVLKNYIIKDTDEETGEDIQDEVWEDPKSRSFCFHGVRVHTFPVFGCIHQHWKLSEAHALGILQSLTCIGVINYLLPFPRLLPSLETWGWRQGWKYQASNHGLVFLVTSSRPGDQLPSRWPAPVQEPTQNCPIRKKDALIY